jgi:hypothetical protein
VVRGWQQTFEDVAKARFLLIFQATLAFLSAKEDS